MAKPRSLATDDRRLFDLATRAAVVNPFGLERERLDRELAALGPDGRADAPPLPTALEAVGARLQALGKSADPRHATDPADRERLRLAHLFVAHHAACDALDEHLAGQLASEGNEPEPFPAGAAILDDLAARGFPADERPRLLALLFQLRRAYHFIDRSLIGASPSIRGLRERLWNNVFTGDLTTYAKHLLPRMEDFATLVLGETGTGKGNAAAAIGRSGFIPYDTRAGRFVESFTRAFVPVNLAEFAPSLLESELFGHLKGAFTGAVADRAGVFARCSPHGSILLDELGELDATVQVKLLRVLQERRFTPVGAHRTERFQGRVIAATNRPQEALVGEGGLRSDLYYRLCSDEIVVPPLRQRLREEPAELELLVGHLVGRLLGSADATLAADVAERLRADVPRDHAWTGNVRELEQAVRRVLLMGAYRPSTSAPRRNAAPPFVDALLAGSLDARALVAAYCDHLHRQLGSYEAVASRTQLDRRTVKKHIEAHRSTTH